MRTERKADWAILTAALITVSLFTVGAVVGAATSPAEVTPAPEQTSRLVSVQQLPENMNDVCYARRIGERRSRCQYGIAGRADSICRTAAGPFFRFDGRGAAAKYFSARGTRGKRGCRGQSSRSAHAGAHDPRYGSDVQRGRGGRQLQRSDPAGQQFVVVPGIRPVVPDSGGTDRYHPAEADRSRATRP